ncbi:MAG TPA: clostripain-related cysteine peptidase [Thermoanaerobaculia bacterium]|nr:clostripain-related cysteine peptidase [Thermoanaerobaculia bacterium]
MSVILRIRCHGVIGYVETPEEANKQVALFLPKAKRRIVPNQVAYLRYPNGTLKKSDHKPGPACEGSLCHIVLKGEHLWIEESDVEDTPLTIVKTKDQHSSTPTSKDGRSIVWVPDMTRLAQDYKADIHKNYFDDPRNTDPRLIARFFFRKGVLESNGVDPVQVPFGQDRGQTVDYGSLAEATRFPIARELLLTLPLKSNSVTIRSKKFKSGEPFAMRFETSEQVLELCLGNESAEDIYEPTLPIQTADTLSAHCMAEFKSYYDMCDPVPEKRLMPYLSSRPGTDTCCSVARFAPREFEFENASAKGNAKKADDKTDDKPPKWSVLAYLAADNSLSPIANDDVDKLERPNAGVGVAVQVDRLDIPTERLLLEEDGFESVGGIHGNLNSGDPEVLIDFLKFGQRKRKAENFAVFLLSHGAGLLNFPLRKKKTPQPKPCWLLVWFHRVVAAFRGFFRVLFGARISAIDLGTRAINPDQTSGDFLDNDELAYALRKGQENGPFAIIGFDACVMALVELAYEIHPSGKFMIASQDEVHYDGLPYGRILRRIRAQEPQGAAKTIVELFHNTSRNLPAATLSAVVLKEVPSLAQALNELGAVLLPLVSSDLDALKRARNRARAFSVFHFIDLRGFAEGLMIELNDQPAVLANARKVLAALKLAVLCTNDDVDPADVKENGACGLSIYLPSSPVDEKVYRKLVMSKDNDQWRDFVIAYSKAIG